jgi:hypothetical protein
VSKILPWHAVAGIRRGTVEERSGNINPMDIDGLPSRGIKITYPDDYDFNSSIRFWKLKMEVNVDDYDRFTYCLSRLINVMIEKVRRKHCE